MRQRAADATSRDEDGALVERAQRGDVDAFGELVEKYQHRMVNLARHLVSNAADAEDIAQDAFIRAYRSLGQFRGTSLFRTWLYQIVTNTARTALTRRVSHPDTATSARAVEVSETLVGPEDVERVLVGRDEVERALAALPDDLRVAVVLRDVEGLDYREMSALLDVPIGTVESRIFRGRARLRAALRPESRTEVHR